MRVSVVGDKKIGVCFARFLKKKGFKLISYYCDDIEEGVKCAVASGCKACTDLKRTVDESELIMIAVPDSSVRRVMRKIAAFNPENKIFCVISSSVDSDLVNIGGDNTYFSAFIPKFAQEKDGFADISDTMIFFEGTGKGFWDLYDVFYMRKINFKMIDKTQKSALVLAAALATDFTKTLLNIADDVLKKANLDSSWIRTLAMSSDNNSALNNGEFNADLQAMALNLGDTDAETSHKLLSVIKVFEVISVSYFN